MREFTDKEKRFIKKLEFTPGIWDSRNICISGQAHQDNIINCIVVDDKQITDNIYKSGDCLLIEQSPAMFLALFHTTYNNVEKGCIKCAHDFPSKDCNKCSKMNQVKILESATGKTWQQLCEIFESLDSICIECKGKGKVWVNFGERDRVLEECQTCSGRGEITL